MIRLIRITASPIFKPAEYHLMQDNNYLGKIVLTKGNKGIIELEGKQWLIERKKWRVIEIAPKDNGEKIVFKSSVFSLTNRGQITINNQTYKLVTEFGVYKLFWVNATGTRLIKIVPSPYYGFTYIPILIWLPIFYFPSEIDVEALDYEFATTNSGKILYLLSVFLLSLKYK